MDRDLSHIRLLETTTSLRPQHTESLHVLGIQPLLLTTQHSCDTKSAAYTFRGDEAWGAGRPCAAEQPQHWRQTWGQRRCRKYPHVSCTCWEGW